MARTIQEEVKNITFLNSANWQYQLIYQELNLKSHVLYYVFLLSASDHICHIKNFSQNS